MLSVARKIQHLLAGRLPYSRVRGRNAHARGKEDAWIEKARRAAAFLDVMASLLLLGSAALALAAVGLSNGWLAASGGIAMALALFSMAGTIWVDNQVKAVEDHAYHANRPRRKNPDEQG